MLIVVRGEVNYQLLQPDLLSSCKGSSCIQYGRIQAGNYIASSSYVQFHLRFDGACCLES